MTDVAIRNSDSGESTMNDAADGPPERHAATTGVAFDGPGSVPWHRQTWSFAQRSLRELLRSRIALFWTLLWPVFWYFLTMILFISEPEGVPAGQLPEVMASIKATNAITYGLFGAFTVSLVVFAQSFTNDIDSKRYRKLRSLPIAPSADLAGRFAAGFLLATASFCGVVAVGVADGAAIALKSLASVPVVFLSLFLFCVIGMSVAVVLSTIVSRGEYLTAITNTLLLVLFFATGYNGVAPSASPMRGALNYVPNSLAARLQVYHMTSFDRSLAGVVPPELPAAPEYLLLLAAFAVAFSGIALVTMRRSVYAGEGGE